MHGACRRTVYLRQKVGGRSVEIGLVGDRCCPLVSRTTSLLPVPSSLFLAAFPCSLLPTPYSFLLPPFSLLLSPFSILPPPVSLLPPPSSLFYPPFSLLPAPFFFPLLSHRPRTISSAGGANYTNRPRNSCSLALGFPAWELNCKRIFKYVVRLPDKFPV